MAEYIVSHELDLVISEESTSKEAEIVSYEFDLVISEEERAIKAEIVSYEFFIEKSIYITIDTIEIEGTPPEPPPPQRWIPMELQIDESVEVKKAGRANIVNEIIIDESVEVILNPSP